MDRYLCNFETKSRDWRERERKRNDSELEGFMAGGFLSFCGRIMLFFFF